MEIAVVAIESMLNVVFVGVKAIDNAVSITLKSRCEDNDIVFLSHIFDELFCIVTNAVVPGNIIEIEM
jgi:hypothetical protein